MYKETTIEFDGIDNVYSVILGNRGPMLKVASSLSDEISKFIKDHKFDTKRYLYVLINALGAEEYYGPNKNGDSFPEYYEGKPNLLHDGKNHGYKTFEEFAKLYKHHVNKDPKRSYGDVLLSIYNPKMHRVELIVRMDRSKAPMEVAKVENGEVLSTSMGTRVPYDVCSICGNKAKTRAQYCYHLKNMMGKILPNGEKVFAINPFPKFFDISMVFVPADVSSRVIKKIASVKSAVEHKKAAIKKEVPAQGIESTKLDDIITNLLSSKFKQMERSEPSLSDNTINMMSDFPLRKILSSMVVSGIMPKPREFQKIVLIKMKKPGLAKTLEEQNLVFNPRQFDPESRSSCGGLSLSLDSIDGDIASILEGYMPSRSRWQPHLLNRLVKNQNCKCIEKQATEDNVSPIMSVISGLYSMFSAAAPTLLATVLATMAGTSPATAALAVGAHVAGSAGQELFKENRYNLGTTNAEELLKLSHINSDLNLIYENKFYGLDKTASKKIASKLTNDIYSVGKSVFKGYGGFSPKDTSMWRRALLSLPVLSFASGIAQAKKAKGEKTNIVTDALAKHPGKLFLLSTLAGHKVPGLFKGASSINSIANDAESVRLLFMDGDLLDIATITKIGNLS